MGKSRENVFVCLCQFLGMGKSLNNIWIKIEGKIVQDGSPEISHYAKVLLNYQKIMQVLQETYFPKARKAQFKLFLTELHKGSSISQIKPQFQQSLLTSEPQYNQITTEFKRLFDALLQGNDQFVNEIETELKDPYEILKFLKPVREILSKKDYHVYTGFSVEMPQSYVVFPTDREEFIDELIKKYTKQASVEIRGIIIKQSAAEPRSFVIRTLDGEMVTVYHTQESENYIHSLFLNPVIAKGILRTGIRKKEFEELVELTPFNKIQLNTLGDFDFINPVSFDVKYHDDDGVWCISNDELSLIGCDKTYEKSLVRLEKNLQGFILGLTSYDEKVISKKSMEIGERLKKYLEIEQYANKDIKI